MGTQGASQPLGFGFGECRMNSMGSPETGSSMNELIAICIDVCNLDVKLMQMTKRRH